MRTRFLALGLALIVAKAASGQVVQETRVIGEPNGAVVQDQAVATPGGVVETRRMSQILGSNVNLQGSPNYGRVEDVMVGPDGRIHSVVVNNNGRYAMLPWQAGNFNHAQRTVTYNVTPQAIQPLYFTQNAWPNYYDQAYLSRVNQVFPNAGVMNRAVMRPVNGAVPSVIGPGGGEVIKEKVRPDGTVKIKERRP